ncbi:restriction endonuclease subunit S [Clostridium perfringens]|uniref:restriction endonuclease subunit S n=1 Tax=Clostridium perfringens TaxID=1502 RepID=UPI002858E514|nr:restriction endonuclease subunit S [Clostridium perfringens]
MSRNVPKLRFKGFEDEWKEKKLINFLSESRIPGSNGSKAKKLTVKLWAKGVVPKKEIYEGSDNTKYYTRKAGQLMYGKLDFLNCAFGIVPDHLDGYESTVDAPAFDIKNINPYFLFSKIIQKNFYKRNGDIADGSRKAKRIHSDVFLNMSIKVPSLEEQEKIANFLSRVDSIIEKQEKKVQYWNSYKKGMMQKIFSQKIRFKDENCRDYPEWEEKKLGSCFLERSITNNNELELLSVTINNGVKKRSDIEGKDNSSDDKSNYKLVEKNDIVYNSMRMWQGASGVSSYRGIVSPAYTILIPQNNVNSYFFAYLFKLEKVINEFRKFSQGLTSDTWNLKYPLLKGIRVKVPCLEEQTKIANFLSNIDNIIDKESKKLEELRQWKKGLFQQMFV